MMPEISNQSHQKLLSTARLSTSCEKEKKELLLHEMPILQKVHHGLVIPDDFSLILLFDEPLVTKLRREERIDEGMASVKEFRGGINEANSWAIINKTIDNIDACDVRVNRICHLSKQLFTRAESHAITLSKVLDRDLRAIDGDNILLPIFPSQEGWRYMPICTISCTMHQLLDRVERRWLALSEPSWDVFLLCAKKKNHKY